MSDDWPTEPPEPTDRHQSKVTSDLPVRKCVYCDELIKSGDGYIEHTSTCDAGEDVIHVDYPNGFFGVVVPEESEYVWRGKTGGFACRNVAIRGTMLPIGTVSSLGLISEPPGITGSFDDFDDPEEARNLYLRGLRASTEYEYGGVDLGMKLVEETLDGVYADDEDVAERKLETRSERISTVWEEIDSNLPFTYERVAAPLGRPVTQEGLRWIDVTGHTREDQLFQKEWVDALIESDDPVALYYPNSD